MPVFEWNDETKVNSYGFRVINAGGDFARFDDNSVMLNSHVNTTEMTLGTWEGRTVEGPKLKGETVFDNVRDSVKEVEGQVDRKVIKGCSMGLALSFDEGSWRKGEDGVMELIKWELMEVSICAVPSLSSALCLYNKDTGKLIPENEFKLSLQNLTANDLKNENNSNMEKIILTPQAVAVLVGMGVTGGDNVAEISNAIVSLQSKVTTAEAAALADKNKVTELQAKLDSQVKLQAKALLDGAVIEGKLTAKEAEDYMPDAIA